MKIKPMLGEFALDGIESVESYEARALVEHRVPGLAGSYFQDLGTAPNSLVIAGTKLGDQARDDFLTGIRGLFNSGKPTTFVADINTATDLVNVVVEDLRVAEIGGDPDAFRYQFRLRKYIEPPQPPSDSLLDGGILGDALGVMDALDALDALGSIPDLGDPTAALKPALDGVKAVTEGLAPAAGTVDQLVQSLPAPSPPTDILAPVLGDPNAGTGVAGVLKRLNELNPANLSVSLSADLNQSLDLNVSASASGAGVTAALTGLQQAVEGIPKDPAVLIGPLADRLGVLKEFSSTGLSGPLRSGVNGLRDLERLVPADATGLIAAAAEQVGRLKGEFLGGEFAELKEWSDSVQALGQELAPLFAGGEGSLEDRLLGFLRKKVGELAQGLLPGTAVDLAARITQQFDGAISAEILAEITSLRTQVIAGLERAQGDLAAGNFTNTIHLAEARASFRQLTDRVAATVGQLRALLDGGVSGAEALASALKKQFDDIAGIRIVDVGNIQDKFAAAIRRIEEAIRKVDLGGVRTTIDKVFQPINDLVSKIDLKGLETRIDDAQKKLQSVLDSLDGTLFQAVAAARATFTRIRDALHTVADSLGSFDAQGAFHFHIQESLESLLDGIKTTLEGTVKPGLEQFRNTVGEALHQVQDLLNSVVGQVQAVQAQLTHLLDDLGGQLKSLNIAGALDGLRQGLDGMIDQLGTIEFDPVVNPVVAQIEEMRDALKKINIKSLNEFTIGALKVSVSVVVKIDFSAQITGALMAEFDKLLQLPKDALSGIDARLQEGLARAGQFQLDALLAPLDTLFQPINVLLDHLKLEVLLEPVDRWHAQVLEGLDRVSPATLLQPVVAIHSQLHGAVAALTPAALMDSLRKAIDDLKAAVPGLDLSGLAQDLGKGLDRVKAVLESVSPERLLDPLIQAFDKVVGALDKFDPAVLLKPLSSIFDGLARPLENLTEAHARAINEAFSLLRGLLDALNPRRLAELLQSRLSAARDLVNQLDVGGLMAALNGPYAAMQASFQASATVGGSSADLSLTASVDALNPLRDPELVQAASDLGRLQDELVRLAGGGGGPLDALADRYEQEIRPKIESLIPAWARENISPASIRRAFQLANPLNLTAEVNQAFAAVKDKLREVDPRLVRDQMKAASEKARAGLLVIDPAAVVGRVQGMTDALLKKLVETNLGLIGQELEGIVQELQSVIAALDPGPIIQRLQAAMDAVKTMAGSLQPSKVLAELDVPLQGARQVVAGFQPSVFRQPLQEAFAGIAAQLQGIHLGDVVEPLSRKLDELRSKLEESLKRTEAAFNELIAAIPV